MEDFFVNYRATAEGNEEGDPVQPVPGLWGLESYFTLPQRSGEKQSCTKLERIGNVNGNTIHKINTQIQKTQIHIQPWPISPT